jgi:hypothetical protein
MVNKKLVRLMIPAGSTRVQGTTLVRQAGCAGETRRAVSSFGVWSRSMMMGEVISSDDDSVAYMLQMNVQPTWNGNGHSFNSGR